MESTFHETDLRAIRHTPLRTTHMTYSELKKKSRYESYNFSLLCLLSFSFFWIFFFFTKKDNHFLWINLMYKINQFFANNFSFFLITHRLIFTYSKANLLVFLNTKFTYSSVIDNGVHIFLHWITKNMVSNSFGHSIVRHILKIKIDSLNFMTLECD